MDYKKVYNDLISKAKSENRQKGQDVYYEAHHIVPRCMGGKGKVSQWRYHPNIVLLTPKEHFISHKLLFMANPSEKKLASAYWFFLSYGHNGESDYRITSREYDWMRREYIKSVKGEGNAFYGKTHSNKVKKIISEKRKGKKFTESQKNRLRKIRSTPEYRKKLSESHKGIPIKESTKKKISESMLGDKNHFYGKKHTEDSKRKMSESSKGKTLSDETKNKISNSLKGLMSGSNHPSYGCNRSESTKKKISESMLGDKNHFYGKKHTEESKIKMSESKKGMSISEETKVKLSKALKGRKKPKSFMEKVDFGSNFNSKRMTCEYCSISTNSGNYKRWHGEKCKSKLNNKS